MAGPAGPVRLESAKTTALLAYLAIVGRPQTRQKLMGLLWEDIPEQKASRNLRHSLWNLKKSLPTGGADWLEATPQAAAFQPTRAVWLDVAEFARACEALRGAPPGGDLESLGRASSLYRGDLLDGFYADGAPAFEEWLLSERERFKTMALSAFQRLASLHRDRGDHESGLLFARRLLALDPWREEAHRTVMQLLALAGSRGAALAQYEACRRVLAEELDAEPTAETTALFERIRDGSPAPAAGSAFREKSPRDPSPIPAHNVPLPPTPFVGREEELARLAGLLAAPACRLITLSGPGGIGKTRVAVQAALRAATPGTGSEGLFRDGVYFVPLAEVASPALLVPTIAAALGFPFLGAGDPKTQLLDFLREKRALVIVDNFEHLLPAAGLLSEILQTAPEVRILATSRVPLKLKEESVLEVGSLGLPARGDAGSPARDSALQLFLQCARRADLGFSLWEGELERLVRVCRLVDGMPLGIELAAAWVRTLSLEEIAEEIGTNLDFLSASHVDVPPRQRSIRAVFDHTWRALGDEEREIFAALSVFRAGFTREAAKTVASASLTALASLVDRSLLRRDSAGRFHLHPVLGQYAAEKLREKPEALEAAGLRHAGYYARFLRSREGLLGGPELRQTVEEIRGEIENVRAAWGRALASRRSDWVADLLEGFAAVHDVNGWFMECDRALEEAARIFMDREASGGASRDLLCARLAIARGRMLSRVSRFAQARDLLRAALPSIRRLAQPLVLAEALLREGEAGVGISDYEGALISLTEGLSQARSEGARGIAAEALCLMTRIHWEKGDLGAAAERVGEGLALASETGDRRLTAALLIQESYVALLEGDYGRAGRCRERALHLAREDGDMASAADALSGLGVVAFFMKDFAKAQGYLEESLAICREIGYRHGMGRAMGNLAENARWRGDCDEAIRWGLEAVEVDRSIGNRRNLGICLSNLGLSCVAAGDPRGERYLVEALETSVDIGAPLLTLGVLVGFAHLAARGGDPKRALLLLGLALGHPARTADLARDAEAPLAELRESLGETAVEEGLALGRGLEMGSVVEEILGRARR